MMEDIITNTLSLVYGQNHMVRLGFLPPNSPDINPVENVFSIMKNFIRSRAPQTEAELRNTIEELTWLTGSCQAQTLGVGVPAFPQTLSMMLNSPLRLELVEEAPNLLKIPRRGTTPMKPHLRPLRRSLRLP
jgi:hypothetical protein